MKNKQFRIAIAQINPKIGDIPYNLKLILNYYKKAKKNLVHLLIFPEMSIIGYPANDLLYDKDIIYSINKALKIIAKKTLNGPSMIIGSPKVSKKAWNLKFNQRFYNSYIFFHQGKKLACGEKICIPNYSVFNEARYFIPGNKTKILLIPQWNLKLAVLICEDLWYQEKNPIYPFSPIKNLMQKEPDILISINASPFYIHKEKTRYELVSHLSQKYKIPILYANLWGNSDGLLFDGQSFISNQYGKIILQSPPFKNDLLISDWNLTKKQFLVSNKKIKKIIHQRIVKIYHALIAAKRDYHEKIQIKKSIIGISGGIDSAIALAIDVAALGYQNVFAILSPSRYSSKKGIQYAQILCENFKVKYKIIPIEYQDNNHWIGIYPEQIKTYKNNALIQKNISLENQQAINRMAILRFYANEENALITGTANKSEIAMGYSTLCGDLQADLHILGDLYKKEIYQLAYYINHKFKMKKIPDFILNRKPSAELSYNQYDPFNYKKLDYFVYLKIEKRLSDSSINKIKKNKKFVFSNKEIENYNMLLEKSEHKRKNSGIIFQIHKISFREDRKIPILKKIAYIK